MAKSESKAGGGGRMAAVSVVVQSGDKIDLSETPLVYGNNDPAIRGTARQAVEAQETKRLSAKSEYAIVLDENGNQIVPESHGSKGKVVVNGLSQATIMTHNHPRGKNEEGTLGGTFSNKDCLRFSEKTRLQTMRASAAEGTYSITKGKGFDADGFRKYSSSIEANRRADLKKATKVHANRIQAEYDAGKIDYATATKQLRSLCNKEFNKYLVAVHNDYLAGQKQYGYSYTLERRSQ